MTPPPKSPAEQTAMVDELEAQMEADYKAAKEWIGLLRSSIAHQVADREARA